MSAEYDDSLDSLLALDGVTFFIDEAGKFMVKFIVKRVSVSAERPHGLSYSLTLYGVDLLVSTTCIQSAPKAALLGVEAKFRITGTG